MKSWVTGQHFPSGARSRISVKDALDVGMDAREHKQLGLGQVYLFDCAVSIMALATPLRIWISSGVRSARLNN
jgi:hypothetical protein